MLGFARRRSGGGDVAAVKMYLSENTGDLPHLDPLLAVT